MAVFDPKLIIYQIAALQCFYYAVMCALLALFSVMFGTPLGLYLMFSSKTVSLSTAPGWTSICTHLVTALAGCVLLPIIVERAKRCLDFTSTVYIIHLTVCGSYEGFPSNWEWWILQTMGFAVMVLLGEYLCSRRELRDIPLFAPMPNEG